MLRMHIISKVKWRRGGWGLPSIIIYLEEIIFNNNNNHLESWVVPLQSREEFSRWGLLPPILGGISNLDILQTPALPNPRYPALPHQDTSYTWTMVDHCYQLWPLITSLPGYSPNCKDQVSGIHRKIMILASAPGAHFDELGTKTDFRQRSITFLIRILLGKLRQIFFEIWRVPEEA